MPANTRQGQSAQPPDGASAEQVLREMLPVVITAATKSAESATAAAAAIRSFEVQLSETKSAVDANTRAIRDLRAALEEKNKATAEKNAWLRTLFQPQFLFPFVLQLIFIILGLLGVRYSSGDLAAVEALLKEQKALNEHSQETNQP